MENQEHHSKFDKALIAVCAFVVLFCTFLIFNGRFLFNNDDTSKLQAVGIIEKTENDVRQKHKVGFSWRGAQNSDQVFEGDSIFTGNVSKAKVKFNKGGELEIDPKSLVVIRTTNSGLELDLRYGAFSGKLPENEKIILIKDGERSELKGSGAEVRITENKIEVKKGKVDIRKPSGETQPIAKTEKPRISIVLTSPLRNSLYWSDKIKYTWKDDGQQGPYSVEFSSGASFKTVLQEKDTVETELTFVPNFDLPENDNKRDLFWRVRSKVETNVVSETRKVTIYNDIAPILKTPEANHVYIFNSADPDSKKVTFEWIEPTLSQNYTIQVAKDTEFNDIVINQTVQNKKFESTALTDGQYFWKVQGTHSSRENAPWSEVRRLNIIEKEKTPPPQILATSKNYVLPLSKVIKSKTTIPYESSGVPVTDFPVFKWKPSLVGSGYKIEVSRNTAFKPYSQKSLKADSTEFKLNLATPGLIGWRVRTLLSKDLATEASEAQFVKTMLPPPPHKDAVPYQEGAEVKWRPLIFAKFYEVQWADNEDFNEPSNAVTHFSKYKVKLPAEATTAFHWRVRALDKDKKPLSDFSRIALLKPAPANPPIRRLAGDEAADRSLSRPIPREPRAQTAVVSFDDAPVFLNFKWAKVPRISTYRFELSRTPDFAEEPIYSTITKETQLLLNQRLPAGELYWRVRGENSEGSWTIWSDPAPLNLQFK